VSRHQRYNHDRSERSGFSASVRYGDLCTVKNLILVRHAKAADGRDDHERPLKPRGQRDARRAGAFLARADCRPQLVLLSTAVRVTQTWQQIADELGATARVESGRDLYLADVDSMHARLVEIPSDVDTVLLVGHNPGITELADWLARRDPSEASNRLRGGFGTAAVAWLTLDLAEWSDITAHRADVRAFWDRHSPIETAD